MRVVLAVLAAAALSGCTGVNGLMGTDASIARTVEVKITNADPATHRVTIASMIEGANVDEASTTVSGNGTSGVPIGVTKGGNLLLRATLENGAASEITISPGSCKEIALAVRIQDANPAFTDTQCR